MKKRFDRITLSLFFILTVFTIISETGCASSKNSKDEPNGIIVEDINPEISEYISDYVPFESKILPQIRISSNSGTDDFIKLPVDRDVSAQKRSWGGYKGEPVPWYENCTITVIDENMQTAIDTADAQVRVRGNWTSNYPKKPLRIKFDEKQSMLGLNGNAKMKNWILLASYKDWSFLRDQTAYYLSHLLSPDYTTDFRMVELYVNNSFYGVYILAEQQEINKKRVNITKAQQGYEGFDIGYLLEMDDHVHQDENYFKINFDKPLKDFYGKNVRKFVPCYSIKNDNITDAQIQFISNYMNNLWRICYEAVYNKTFYKFNDEKTGLIYSDAETCYECINEVVDLESLVNTYIFHEIVCDADFYFTSFYMDVDLGEKGSKKLKFEANWDFDSSLGNKNFCADSQGLFAGVLQWDVNHEKKEIGNPWFLIFINCNWFQEMVRQKWSMIHQQDIYSKLASHIDFVSSNYKESFDKDYNIWKNVGKKETIGELCTAAASCKTEKIAAEYLKLWLDLRFEALDGLWME